MLCEVVGGMQRDGRPGQVHETKGTESDPEGFAGDGVNLRSVGRALFEQKTGFVKPRHEEAVHNEARSVSANDDHFSEHFAILNDLVNGFLARRLGWNHFNETILGWMVEEMQADKTVGSSGRLCERVDRERRGVGSEDGPVATGLVQGVEHRRLHVKIFEHGLDHKIRVLCRVFYADHTRNAALNGVDLGGRENTSLDGLFKEVRNDGLASLNPLLFTVHHLDIEFFLGTFLSDAGTHVPCTNNGHTLNRLCHEGAEFNDAHEAYGLS